MSLALPLGLSGVPVSTGRASAIAGRKLSVVNEEPTCILVSRSLSYELCPLTRAPTHLKESKRHTQHTCVTPHTDVRRATTEPHTHTVDYYQEFSGGRGRYTHTTHLSRVCDGKVSTRVSGFRILVLWSCKTVCMIHKVLWAVSGVSVGPARDPSAESQQARPSVSELTLYPAGRLLVASSAWQPPGRDVRAKLSLVGSPL